MISKHSRNMIVTLLVSAMFSFLFAIPQTVNAGEGGTSHVLPGTNSTLVDLVPTKPGWFLKPMYMHYNGKASAQISTASRLTTNLDVTANTTVLGGGYTFKPTILGGAHYTAAAFLPYGWLDVSANVQTPVGTLRRKSSVSSFGDLTVVPVMLAWKN